MKKSLCATGLLLFAAGLFITGGCKSNPMSPSYGTSAQQPGPTAPNNVLMSNMSFSPTTIHVAKNTTITWMNNDGLTHTSTSDSGLWDTGNLLPGQSATTTFATAGTFPFHCTIHASMMRGTVVVQ